MPQFDSEFFASLGFWAFVSFGLLLMVLRKFALPQVVALLEERERKIKESLDQAERIKNESQQLMVEYEAKLRAAQQEAHGLIEASRARAQEVLEEAERRAAAEGQRIVAEARTEIERERLQAVRDIRTAAVDLTISASEKVLQRALTAGDHRRMIEQAIDELVRQPGK